MRRSTAALAVTLLLTGGALAGCASSGGEGPASADGDPAAEKAREEALAEAADPGADQGADQRVCASDATPVTAPYEGFPTAWTFPADTTVYDVEDRGETGVIVTAIATAPFEAVLAHLNGEEQDLGFEVVGGETEDDDAEANWTADGFTGRWTIRRSDSCPGETVVQVLATATG